MTSTRIQPKDIVLTFEWTDAIEALYVAWHREVAGSEHAHRLAGDRLRRRHLTTGAVLLLATLLIAGVAFGSLTDAGSRAVAVAGLGSDAVLVALGSLGVLAALLAAVLLFGRAAIRGEQHRIAATRYASLRREMAAALAMPRDARALPDDALNDARRRIGRYGKESPAIPRRLRRRLEQDQRPSSSQAWNTAR